MENKSKTIKTRIERENNNNEVVPFFFCFVLGDVAAGIQVNKSKIRKHICSIHKIFTHFDDGYTYVHYWNEY